MAGKPLWRQKRFPRAPSKNRIRMEGNFRASMTGFWWQGKQFIANRITKANLPHGSLRRGGY